MFLTSRFVVVDDKALHLKGIKDSLESLRYDCHTMLYDEEAVDAWTPFPGLRMLFIDRNLRAGVTMGQGSSSAFAAIVEVIQKLITQDNGPYGIILWAEDPQLESFKSFLFERLGAESPDLLPVFCDQLTKGDYIDTTTGSVVAAQRLKSDILQRMEASPQMRALFSWETDVVVAIDAVLKSLVKLVPASKRRSDEFGGELGKVLFRLSQAGSGADRAMESPREGINRVLVPILADRILEHDPEGQAHDLWKTALVVPTDKKPTVQVQAAVNSAIHISTGAGKHTQPIKAIDLGAVVEFPWKEDEALFANFGVTAEQMKGDTFFGMTDSDWNKAKLRLVQIGAACDQAQPKPAPLLYLLGLEWPFAQVDGEKGGESKLYNSKSVKMSGIEWRSPVIAFDGHSPGRLSVFLNSAYSATKEKVQEWKPVYRLREELVSKLTQDYARHVSRPGIVAL